MAQPTAYSPAHEFLTDEAATPAFPGSEIDIELAALNTTLDQILVNLALIQRDDGALKNEVVTVDSLDTTLAAALGDVASIATVEALIAAANADAVATAADVVLTHADVVLTHADVVTVTADKATVAADKAIVAADKATVAADKAIVAADKATVTADKATVAADKVIVAADKATVTADAGTVAADKAIVAADKATVAADKAIVAADKATTLGYKNDAATSATNAAASYDSFDDRYLGPYAADPTLDNDGNALLTGAMYFNTTTGLKFYNGVSWSAINADMLKADNLSGLANYTTARANMGLAIGTDVQAFDATLLSIAALGTAADKMLYTTGVDTWAELAVTSVGRGLLDDATQAAQQTTLGLGTGDSPQFTAVNIGHASDTTVSRAAAGVIAVEDVPLYSNIPQNSQSVAYTLVAADAQKHVYHPGADTTARIWTIPANASVAYPIGSTITFVNDTSAGIITIAITTDTLVLAGTGATGSRSLAANGIATALKITSTRWIISGVGLS